MGALVIFSVDVPRLARFYEHVLQAQPSTESSGDIRLHSEFDEVLIHSVPARTAARIDITVPPTAREGCPIKPVFEVRGLPEALQRVAGNGGVVTDRTFTLDGMTRHDVIDPEGNVIQLRSLR